MTPKRNNRPFSTTLFPLLVRVLGSLNVDYTGLESTFLVPRYAQGLPEKGSILYHLGLQKTLASDCKSVLSEGFRVFSGTLVEQIHKTTVS
jgi:hypothetical protein